MGSGGRRKTHSLEERSWWSVSTKDDSFMINQTLNTPRTHCTHTCRHTLALLTYRPLLHDQSWPLVDLVVVWWWGDAAALRVHPAVHVVGDVTSWDPTHRADRHGQFLTSLQHLQQEKEKEMKLIQKLFIY